MRTTPRCRCWTGLIGFHLLKREELEQIEYGKESLMPNHYGRTLSAERLQDLLAFLSRQVRQ